MKLTIKNIGIIVLITLLVTSVVSNFIQDKKNKDRADQVTLLSGENNILKESMKNAQISAKKKDTTINILIDSITYITKNYNLIRKNYSGLMDQYNSLSEGLLKVSSDSSYRFLQDVYPYPGDLAFMFNEPQVKAIHLDYLKKLKLTELNGNLKSQVDTLNYLLGLNRKAFALKSSQYDDLKLQLTECNKLTSNQSTQIGLQQDQIKNGAKVYLGASYVKTDVGRLF
ncbi:hypothetical protein, partial [Lentimicrobium sp.]|uniref:hypothetical protein n=1 Tax=Lentimicrobium sp. TaxID=2034841 RepID=UPI00345E606E